MRTIWLDGRRMVTIEEAHRYLKRRLSLPDYYGANLDALWDVMSPWDQPLRIRILAPEVLRSHLGDYGDALIQVFLDAAESNRNLQVAVSRRDHGAGI